MSSRPTSGIRARCCVGAGFVALDIIQADTRQDEEFRFAGGSCGNVAAILSYLGWESAVIARIGSDEVGEELVGDLNRWSVNTELIDREPLGKTPVIFQQIYSGREGKIRHRFSRNCPICTRMAVGYRPLRVRDIESISQRLPESSAFYFDRVAPGNVELARRANLAKAIVIFEPSGVNDPRLFLECLKLCHVFKYASDRLNDVHEAAAMAGVPIEVRTKGDQGLTLTVRNPDGESSNIEMPALVAPRLRDVSGSGDWCTAGFLDSLSKNSWEIDALIRDQGGICKALRAGQALAALNCAFEGARGLMYAFSSDQANDFVSRILNGEVVEITGELPEVTLKRFAGPGCPMCGRSAVSKCSLS